jgi:predicted RNA-binding Zn ribbon-like protein
MRSSPPSISSDPTLPFKYVGGDPSIELVNTVDWTARGLESERLTDYERLTRWAEGAGVLSPEDGARLRQEAGRRPDEAAAAYEQARWLRWVLQRVFTAVGAGERPGDALDELNLILAETLGRLRLVPSDGTASDGHVTRWGWDGMGERLDSALWPVVRSAAELLASDEAGRVHVCAGPDCGWMYVDRSRNGLRRWCQTGTCGARAKARRYYARKRAAGVDARPA